MKPNSRIETRRFLMGLKEYIENEEKLYGDEKEIDIRKVVEGAVAKVKASKNNKDLLFAMDALIIDQQDRLGGGKTNGNSK